MGVWRRFTAAVFDGVLSCEEMETLHSLIKEWRARYPGKTADLAVIYPTRAGMTSAERKKWVEILKATEHVRLAGATVVLADGMLGSVHRGIITSFNLIAPPPHPVKVCSTVSAALTWLAPYIEETCGSVPIPALERELAALSEEIQEARRATA